MPGNTSVTEMQKIAEDLQNILTDSEKSKESRNQEATVLFEELVLDAGFGCVDEMRSIESATEEARDRVRKNDWTLLHIASYQNYTKLCEFLLTKEVGASIDSEEFNCRTPLSIAAKCGNLETVKMLCEHEENKAEIDHLSRSCELKGKEKRTLTPLVRACSAGSDGAIDARRIEVIEYLLSLGADPTKMTIRYGHWYNGTPYHTALHLLIISADKSEKTDQDRDCIMRAIRAILESKNLSDKQKLEGFLAQKTFQEYGERTSVGRYTASELVHHFMNKGDSKFWRPIADIFASKGATVTYAEDHNLVTYKLC